MEGKIVGKKTNKSGNELLLMSVQKGGHFDTCEVLNRGLHTECEPGDFVRIEGEVIAFRIMDDERRYAGRVQYFVADEIKKQTMPAEFGERVSKATGNNSFVGNVIGDVVFVKDSDGYTVFVVLVKVPGERSKAVKFSVKNTNLATALNRGDKVCVTYDFRTALLDRDDKKSYIVDLYATQIAKK